MRRARARAAASEAVPPQALRTYTDHLVTRVVLAILLGSAVLGRSPLAAQSLKPAAPSLPVPDAALVKTYCVGCHNERSKTGGLSLADYDPAQAEKTPQVTEKIIRKLTAGMMPPAGVRRPEPAATHAFVAALAARVDAAAAKNPNPGWRPVSAPHARGVRAGGEGPARRRARRHRVPAARYRQPRLRQHRRGAEFFADLVRGVSARRRPGDAARGWRSPRVGHVGDLHGAARSNRRCGTSKARRSARVAASRSCMCFRQTAPTSSASCSCAPSPASSSATPRSRSRAATSRWRFWSTATGWRSSK